MPLLRFDLIAGRSPSQLASMLDAAHLALVQAFKVPVRDRYQIVHEHTGAPFSSAGYRPRDHAHRQTCGHSGIHASSHS